jgi:tetratricopeptide (TPR) repeat protein
MTICLSYPVNACIWVKGTTREGKGTRTSGLTPFQVFKNSLSASHDRWESIEHNLRYKTEVDERNDYAVALIYLGRAKEAVSLLRTLEKEEPGDYGIAANLGTALELSGNNEEALEWINEGMRRNSDSHEGTEWLHSQILRAKIRFQTDPHYFDQHSVLNVDFEKLEHSSDLINVAGTPMAPDRLRKALIYQLKERLQFVKTNDLPVASLLWDLAGLEAGTHTLESAIQLLTMAQDFGYPRERVAPMILRYSNIIRMAQIRRWVVYSICGSAFLAFIVYAIRRGWIIYTPSQSTKR